MKNLLSYLLICLPACFYAQSVIRLDTTFADHGFSVVDHQTFESLACMAIQPDGKIVAAGFTEENHRTKFAVLRYHPDGSLDAGFGQSGIYTGQLQTTINIATAIDVQPDGKILVAGYCMSDVFQSFQENLFVLRLTAEGNADNTFGDGGFQVFDLFRKERAVSIKAGPNGKIYVLGNSYKATLSDIVLLSYNSDGTPDANFGTGGYVKLANSGYSWNYATNMAIQPDGKIVIIADSRVTSTGSNITLMRVHPNGSFDVGFNGDGKVTNSLSLKDDVPFSVVVLPDGKILVGGYSVGTDTKTNFAILKFTADGEFDTGFGNSGKVITPVGDGYGSIAELCVTPGGGILAVGTAKNTCSLFDYVVAKYDQNGVIQADFGDQGFLYTDFEQHYDGVSEARLTPDGKLYAVGTGVNPANSISEFLMVRYNVDLSVGTFSPSPGGAAFLLFPNPANSANVTLQFNLEQTSDVAVDLFSLSGQNLGSLLRLTAAEGPQEHLLTLPAGLPKGCYLAGIHTGSGRTFIKLMVQ